MDQNVRLPDRVVKLKANLSNEWFSRKSTGPFQQQRNIEEKPIRILKSCSQIQT